MKKSKSGVYFTQDTENAIIKYNNSTDQEYRSLLYSKEIHPALLKLTENIIHTFKFYYTDVENLSDLQHEVITFILSKLHLFDPSKGAKAYSYFGTIAKRYLIVYNVNNYKKLKQSINVGDITLKEDSLIAANPALTIDSEVPVDSQYRDNLSFFMDIYVEACTNFIYELFPNDLDAKIADAVLELFRKRDNLQLYNKKALYLYIREIIDVKTSQITKVTKVLNEIFSKSYQEYLDTGIINLEKHIYKYNESV
jgi:hypothetical protein